MRCLPLLAAILLAACGTRGPLVLPPMPQPAPAPAKSAPVKSAPADNSSKAPAAEAGQ